MEFKYRNTGGGGGGYSYDHDGPPPPHSSSGLSYFALQALRVGYTRPDLARAGNYFPSPINMHESILRESEKQQIREEIIAAEVVRRRQLEAEVRREMMMEREMMLQGAYAHDFPIFSGPSATLMNSRLPISNHSENRFRDVLPFSRSSEVRITEVKASPEVNKERVILLPKPEGNISGIKRKAVTPPALIAALPLANPNKKIKEILHCEICRVSATSERALKEHFQGKKHKSKEARHSSQITGQNFAIGLFSRKATKQNKLPEITEDLEEKPKEKAWEKKLVEEVNEDVVLQVNKNSDHLKNAKGRTAKKVEKDSLKFKFWCPMCKIGAFSEKVMNAHMRGKKHTSMLLESLNSRLGVASENEKVPESVIEKKVTKVKSAIASGNKDGAEMIKPQIESSVKKEDEERQDADEVSASVGSGRFAAPLLIGWVE